jgi:hypothetical protein
MAEVGMSFHRAAKELAMPRFNVRRTCAQSAPPPPLYSVCRPRASLRPTSDLY